jgi:xanthine dehydrogenase YagS FAD-binding subunit
VKLFSYNKISDTPQAAVASASQHPNAHYIGGGTNIIDLMKNMVMIPDSLIDVSELGDPGIRSTSSGGIIIGAAAKNSYVANHRTVRDKYPVLARALLSGASPQLRNMASTAGNALQRTRCFYFYDTASACNKREPGSGCDAMHGYNRMHAILGTSDQCIATHPSDMCVAMSCLDAIIHTVGKAGERKIPFIDFHKLPEKTPHIENALQENELITAIELPAPLFTDSSCYLKIRDRASYAFALVSVAAGLDLSGGQIRNARLALGGVATKPWRAVEAEEILKGKNISQDVFAAAAESALKQAKTFEHNAFKVELAKKAIIRALAIASRSRQS